MRPGAGEATTRHDEVLVANRAAIEEALEDLPDSGRVASLRRQRRARNVRRHPVMRHRPPGVVVGRRLGEPDIAGVPREPAALQRAHHGVAVADLPPGRIHEVRTPLHCGEQVVIEKPLGPGVQRRVDRDDVAVRHHVGRALVKGQAQLAFHVGRKPVAIGVVEVDVKSLEAPQHARADATGGDRSDGHPLEVVRPLHAVGNVPSTPDDPPIGRDVIAHERQDHHHHVLRHADAVRIGHLGHRHPLRRGRLQVDVVRADTCGDGQLEVRRLGDPLCRQVRRPERLRNDDVRIDQLPFENRLGPVLVRRDDQRMAGVLEESAEPELSRHAAEKLSRSEIDCVGRRRRLSTRIRGDDGDGVAGIGAGVAVDGIVIEHAQDLCHFDSPRSPRSSARLTGQLSG